MMSRALTRLSPTKTSFSFPATPFRRNINEKTLNHKLIGPSFRQSPSAGLKRQLTTNTTTETTKLPKSRFNIHKTQPFIFGTSIALVKNAGVDILVQKYVEGAEELDLRRVAVFGTFGMLFCGAWQYFLFVKVMPKLCPAAEAFAAKPIAEKLKDIPGLKQLAFQNFVENGINNPILYFPIFYTIKEWLEGGPLEDGIAKYKMNMKEDVIAIWKVWIPAQFFNFAFSPMWFRVPFVACVSAFWTGYVSMTRGKKQTIPAQN